MSKVTCSCFTFLVPSGHEEQDEEKKDSEEDLQASVVKVTVHIHHMNKQSAQLNNLEVSILSETHILLCQEAARFTGIVKK